MLARPSKTEAPTRGASGVSELRHDGGRYVRRHPVSLSNLNERRSQSRYVSFAYLGREPSQSWSERAW
jgi:hypothetical protein